MTQRTDPRSVPAVIAAVLLLVALAGSITVTARRAEEAAGRARTAADRTRLLVAVAKVQLQGIENGVLLYSLEQGGFPDGNGTEIPRRLANPVKDEFGDLEPAWLDGHSDPWGNPYNYQWPNHRVKDAKKPAIWSNGPNGANEFGGGDDIRNW